MTCFLFFLFFLLFVCFVFLVVAKEPCGVSLGNAEVGLDGLELEGGRGGKED